MSKIGGENEKRIDGKIYHRYHALSRKIDAETLAKRIRKDGDLARVVTTKYWYVVYRRVK